ncbi:hypothetical protein LCGC14_3130640 [marine sediment metagenome]|uniref:Uncharacterized protein n=1 Tax=marine sediment metagenome TaxID=412755 RepID=A0A0F8WNP7_9ZZZZ
MSLANKPVYPFVNSDGFVTSRLSQDIDMASFSGITYKEALVLALAGNSEMVLDDDKQRMTYEWAAQSIVSQADSILKELEK